VSTRTSKLYADESPIDRTRNEVLAQIAAAESYRVGILKSVSTFSGRLGNEAYATAAQSMDEVYYNKDDTIIDQDDMGDSFFILEVGEVKVTVCT
jgi:CRP-like cAMP-binding protein